ncbi:MAG: hypothetical protein IJ561_01690 [Ruminococcus sp.]|nr:hypothetical protein [Ruminococcus sp.]
MPLPFLIGGLASIRGGKNKKGSVKEAVKRHNGNLEKLRIKENDCSDAINDLEMKKIKALSSLSGIVERARAISNCPKLDYISFSNVKLQGFDEETLLKAAEDPQWFLSSRRNDEGSYLLENKAALTISEDADKAWEEMEQAQEKIYSQFKYYDRLQNIAEQFAACVENVRDLYEKHLKVLDQFKAKTGKTDWNLYNETEKFATQNTVQLAVLLYELCSAELIVPDKDKPDTEWINETELRALMDKAKALCSNKGFEYHGETYDVILRGDAKSYFSYRYRLEDRLAAMLPISSDQTAPILEKLRMDSNVSIVQDVTHMHARAVLDKLRDIDIKSQRVPSPDGQSTFYAELIIKERN